MSATWQDVDVRLPRRRPWWRRWLRRVVLMLLLALVGLGFRGYYRHRKVTRELEAALAALDHDETGWRLKDIEAARADVPEEANSARCIVAVAKLLKEAAPSPHGWPPAEFADAFKDLPPEERLDDARAARLRAELEKVRPALELARTLERLPAGRHRIQYLRNVMDTRLDDQQQTRNVTGLLSFDAMQRSDKNDGAGALRACRAALNAARSIGDEPFFVTQLVRAACVVVACRGVERALAQTEPPPEDLARTQRQLEGEDAYNGLFVSLRGERAVWHEMFDALESGDVPLTDLAGSGAAKPDWSDHLLGWAIRDNLRAEHPLFLSLMTRRITETELPLEEQGAIDRDLAAQVKALPREAVVTRVSLTAIPRVGEAECRKHAHVRCLAAALAAERYRRQHGAWPESLDKLVPGLLTELPLDPSDGEPLRYRRLADGVTIYAVGKDGVDNGGVFDRENGIRPGTDIGIRLWDVKHRRQPPRPKEKAPEEPGAPGGPPR